MCLEHAHRLVVVFPVHWRYRLVVVLRLYWCGPGLCHKCKCTVQYMKVQSASQHQHWNMKQVALSENARCKCMVQRAACRVQSGEFFLFLLFFHNHRHNHLNLVSLFRITRNMNQTSETTNYSSNQQQRVSSESNSQAYPPCALQNPAIPRSS
jgi:hypothetical protein